MNPGMLIFIIIVAALFYYGFLVSEGGFFGNGHAPIATGPGSSAIQNPQPVSSFRGSSGYGSYGASPSPTPKPLTFAEMNALYGPCVNLPTLMYHHIQPADEAGATSARHCSSLYHFLLRIFIMVQ